MPQRVRERIEGRDIHIVTGRLSQTVNVCDANNRIGEYDWIVRLFGPNFVSGDEVRQRASISGLIQWLRENRSGRVEQTSPFDGEQLTISVEQPITPNDALWIQRAMQITGICINELVLEFLDFPYLHRVEHSIHIRLHSILSVQPHFARHFSLANGIASTQPIHKEWPEITPRPEKGNRRGNFELAILSPDRLKTCTLDDFKNGRVIPPIVIEMGMNYDNGHLANDAEKLLNSQVEHGYLVHLMRERPHDDSVDHTIMRLQQECTIRIAFARIEGGKKYLKLLEDPRIREVT
jgi:hypothetical protein